MSEQKRTGARGRGGGGRRAVDEQDAPRLITRGLLRAWPLPQPEEGGDKEERGRVLVVGGSREMAGAVILAGVAALRAGAGKLQIATARGVAPYVAAQVPEARVFALPETRGGAVAASAAAVILERAADARAVLIGPGMADVRTTTALVLKVVPRLGQATLIADPNALDSLAENPKLLRALAGRAVITPHAEEMAVVRGESKEAVAAGPLKSARESSRSLGAVVALKGRETFVVAPSGEAYANRAGNVGLATSGSGDVLAGLIAGLAARGADAFQAAVWGVHLHALAGERLARRTGPLGYLARELPGEIPSLLRELAGGSKRRTER